MTSVDTTNPSTGTTVPSSVSANTDLTAVVGGVGHILRGAFSDLYGTTTETTSPSTRMDNTNIPSYEDNEELRDVSKALSDSPSMDQIDMRRDDVVHIMNDLEYSLKQSQSFIENLDDQHFQHLRSHHLAAKEVPVPSSPPRTTRRHDVEERLGPGASKGLVSPGDIMHDVQKDILVRTGNLHVGQLPSDYRSSATSDGNNGEPHYLQQVNAGAMRTKSNVERFTKTVGGFGPLYHRTQEPGLVDVPTTSGKSGVQVSLKPTLVKPTGSVTATQSRSGKPSSKSSSSAITVPKSSLSSALPPNDNPSTASNQRDRQNAMQRSVSFSDHPTTATFNLDDEIARSNNADEPYADALLADPDQERILTLKTKERTSRMTAAERKAEMAAAILHHVPDGVAGTRGEGLEGSLSRQGMLDYARKNAGAGTAGALSLDDIAQNNNIIDRMSRPLEFLKNPRHEKTQRSTLLVSGAKSGTRGALAKGRATSNTYVPPANIELIPPGTGTLQPVRSKSPVPTKNESTTVFQSVGADGVLTTSPSRSNRTMSIGVAAELGSRRSAYLPSKGVPLPSTLLHTKGLAVTSESFAGTFVVRPAVVDFLEYDTGSVLTTTITLQNVDSLSRHIRILPPTTRIFTIDIPQFPGAVGPGGMSTAYGVPDTLAPTAPPTSVVAPGMMVKINITFRPPAAAPYEDELTLVTEAGSFTIPLRGCLPGPELSLPLHIEGGVALQYDVNRMIIPVTNIGAKAQFRILPIEIFNVDSATAVALSDHPIAPGTVPGLPMDVFTSDQRAFTGPFAISPTSFELNRNDKMDLTVLFAPNEVGPFRRSFVVVASDGSVFTHTMEAECTALRVGVSMVHSVPVPEPAMIGIDPDRPLLAAKKTKEQLIPPASNDTVPGSLLEALTLAVTKAFDTSATDSKTKDNNDNVVVPTPDIRTHNPPCRLHFDDIFPGTNQSKTITIRNDTALPVRYSWKIEGWNRLAPQIDMPNWDEEDTRSAVRKSRSLVGKELPTLPEASDIPTDLAPPRTIPPPLPFTISPSFGDFAPFSDTVFNVTFAPWTESSSSAVAYLDIHDVPRDPRTVADEKYAEALAIVENEVIAASRPTSRPGEYTPKSTSRAATPTNRLARVHSSEVRPLTHTTSNDNDGDEGKRNNETQHQEDIFGTELRIAHKKAAKDRATEISVTVSHAADSVVHRHSLTIGKFHLHGSGRSVDVVVDSPTVALPGPLLPGHTAAQGIRLINRGDAPVHFSFPTATLNGRRITETYTGTATVSSTEGGGSFTISPPTGIIPARGDVLLTMTYTGSQPGRYMMDFDCQFYHCAYGPALLSSPHASSTSYGTNNGVVAVLASEEVRGESSNSLRIHANAAVRCPEVRFTEPLVNLGLVGCDRTVTGTVRIVNTSDAPARYYLARVRGPGSPIGDGWVGHEDNSLLPTDTDIVTDTTGLAEIQPYDMDGVYTNLEIEKAVGMLEPREEKEITVTFDTGASAERLRIYLRAAVIPLDAPLVNGRLSSPKAVPSSPSKHSSLFSQPPAYSLEWHNVPAELRSPCSYMRITGEVQSPRVTLSTHAMALGVVFVGVPVHHTVTLTNACSLDIDYKFDGYVGMIPPNTASFGNLLVAASNANKGTATGTLASLFGGGSGKNSLSSPKTRRAGSTRDPIECPYEITIEPSNGKLGPKESRVITLTIVPRIPGLVQKSLLACDVIGMPYPLGLEMDMLIKGVTIAYALVDDATGFVITPPALKSLAQNAEGKDDNGTTDTNEASDSLALEFAKSMENVDPALRHDAIVRSISDAYERAGEIGATIGRVPKLVFGKDPHSDAPEPLPLLTRQSYSLHILNLSGIPTAFEAAVDRYAADDAAMVNGSGETNWPALYSAADAITVHGGPKPYRNVAGSGAAAVKAVTETRSGSPTDKSTASVPNSQRSRSLSPVNRISRFRGPVVTKYGSQPIRFVGEGESSLITLHGHPSGSLTFKAVDNVPGTAATTATTTSSLAEPTNNNLHASSHTSSSLASSANNTVSYKRSTSTSPVRRPKWFLTNAIETTNRFNSVGGRAHIAQQETLNVMRRSLAKGTGFSLEVYPQKCTLPPFGHIAVQIGAVANMPGIYKDTLHLFLQGTPELLVPVESETSGNPLAYVTSGTVGLQVNGACGATGPTVNFGDTPEYGPVHTKTITIENNGPRDAHLTWHTMHDRAPNSIPPAVSVDILDEEELDAENSLLSRNDNRLGVSETLDDEEEDDEQENDDDDRTMQKKGPQPSRDRSSSPVRVVVRPFTDRVDVPPVPHVPTGDSDNTSTVDGASLTDTSILSLASKATPPPFTLTPNVVIVPAYGRTTIRVSATAEPISPANRALAEHMGWSGELLKYNRVKFAADAIFVKPSEQPSALLLDRAARPYTPEGLRTLDHGTMGTDNDEEFEEVTGFAVRRKPVDTKDTYEMPHSKPTLVRDALFLHGVIRPFAPLLQLDRALLADGRPYIGFSVWSLALDAGRNGTVMTNPSSNGPIANAVHPSCRKSFALTNAAGSDLVFTLRVEGPFMLTGTHTAAPKHPITRVDILHQPLPTKGQKSLTGKFGTTANHNNTGTPTTFSASLTALFAPGALVPLPDGSTPKIHSLPPQTNMTVDIAFDPNIGHSLKTTAAALFFSNDKVTIPNNALTSTVRNGSTSLGETNSSLGNTLVDRIEAIANNPEGTITLGSTGGIVGTQAGILNATQAIDSVITASVTRLKGEYVGKLIIMFSNGSTQEIGLRAEVVRPAITAAPAAHTFGTIRVTANTTTSIHLANPTTVDAHWSIRHVPSSNSGNNRPPRPGENVDWRSLGLPNDPLWTPPSIDPLQVPVDDPAVFAFSNVSGILAGPTVPVDMSTASALRSTDNLPKPLEVKVLFAPKAAVLYQSRFRISVKQGESFEVILRGRGTYEEI